MDEKNTLPVFSGDTQQCLEHYINSLQGNIKQAFNDLKNFIKSNIARRVLQKNIPRGINLVKLRCFLANKGYEVVELKALQPEVYQIVCLIASDKITYEELNKRLDFHPDTTLKILRGIHPTSEATLTKIAKIIKSLKGELTTIDIQQKKPVTGKLKEISLDQNKNMILHMLASKINGALPLAQLVDSFTDEDREKLRELTFGKGIFELSNLLFGFCSNAAYRSSHKNKEAKEVIDDEE